jgi:hypothetical protein
MRGWPLVEPVVTESFSLPQLLETDDQWIRRRFLLTLIRGLRLGNYSKLKSLLVDHVRYDSLAARSTRFEIALKRWLRLKAGIDFYATSRKDISEGHTDLAVLIDALKLRRNVNDIYRFSAALDYHCINLDYSSSPEALHVGGAYSEGRYGIIRQWVEEGLASVHEDLLFTFIDDVLKCADEGVRWAISVTMPDWLPKISKITQRRKLILKLLSDWHPWVLRESLEQMGQRLSNFHGLDSLEVLITCSDNIERAVEQGWDEKEFLPGYLRASAYYPHLVDQIKIRRVA